MGDGSIVFNHTDNAYSLAPDITGAGGVEVYSGTTTLTGKSSYPGGTDVFGGKLVVNGAVDALSGEIHASANTVLRDAPRQVEKAILSRIDTAFAAKIAFHLCRTDDAGFGELTPEQGISNARRLVNKCQRNSASSLSVGPVA